MPLSKQAKALYEAALRSKGLQPGKAVRQDPRTFVGPIEMYKRSQPYDVRFVEGKPRTQWRDEMVPRNTYWNHRGRFQDLEDELDAAIDAGIWERKNPMAHTYYRYYNDGDIPRGIVYPAYQRYRNSNYNDVSAYRYHLPDWEPYPNLRTREVEYRQRGLEPHLTRLGELELEARADEMIENDYKDYLRKMYQRFPNREAVREQFPEEYNAMPYLEELFPE